MKALKKIPRAVENMLYDTVEFTSDKGSTILARWFYGPVPLSYFLGGFLLTLGLRLYSMVFPIATSLQEMLVRDILVLLSMSTAVLLIIRGVVLGLRIRYIFLAIGTYAIGYLGILFCSSLPLGLILGLITLGGLLVCSDLNSRYYKQRVIESAELIIELKGYRESKE